MELGGGELFFFSWRIGFGWFDGAGNQLPAHQQQVPQHKAPRLPPGMLDDCIKQLTLMIAQADDAMERRGVADQRDVLTSGCGGKESGAPLAQLGV